MKQLAIALLVLIILFNIAINVNIILRCDGTVVHGMFYYECIQEVE